MTIDIVGIRRPRRARSWSWSWSWSRLVLSLVTLLGLVVMHQLAGGHTATEANPSASQYHEGGQLRDAAYHPGGGHHPGDQHGPPGQVCQLVKPTDGVAVPMPVPGALPPPAPPTVAAVTPHTAVREAADGSGCGPPSLTELSISRT